jgi:hypothetical protein
VPAFLTDGAHTLTDGVTVLFWSGGKDSFLALRALLRAAAATAGSSTDHRSRFVLLTTFDRDSRFVAHQEVPVASIVRQAAHLGLALVGVPLPRRAELSSGVDGGGGDYLSCIRAGLEVVRSR